MFLLLFVTSLALDAVAVAAAARVMVDVPLEQYLVQGKTTTRIMRSACLLLNRASTKALGVGKTGQGELQHVVDCKKGPPNVDPEFSNQPFGFIGGGGPKVKIDKSGAAVYSSLSCNSLCLAGGPRQDMDQLRETERVKLGCC